MSSLSVGLAVVKLHEERGYQQIPLDSLTFSSSLCGMVRNGTAILPTGMRTIRAGGDSWQNTVSDLVTNPALSTQCVLSPS